MRTQANRSSFLLSFAASAVLSLGGCDEGESEESIAREMVAPLLEAGLEADSRQMHDAIALLMAAGMESSAMTEPLSGDALDLAAAELDDAELALSTDGDLHRHRAGAFSKTGYGVSHLWCSLAGMSTARIRAQRDADDRAQSTCGNAAALPVPGTQHVTYTEPNNRCRAAYTRMYSCL
ncbi:MAG: hypothetical protein ACE37F_25055 [Nannocystaceae bacterium]|nr:hypothetical protein [bacterium]